MPIRPDMPWHPGLPEFSKHSSQKEYCLMRQNGHDSQSRGPLYLHWEDAIVGAAIVNGHMTREKISEYADGYAGKDPMVLEEALSRIEANVHLLRQFGWKLPDFELEPALPIPG